jgi:hypothetical protein
MVPPGLNKHYHPAIAGAIGHAGARRAALA